MLTNGATAKTGLILTLGLLFLTGCISRAAQPNVIGMVQGMVADSDELVPLADVTIISNDKIVKTDAQGRFSVAERRYYAFLPKEIFYMEAPSSSIELLVGKLGYQTCRYWRVSEYGGSVKKGHTQDIGTIVLLPETSSEANHDTHISITKEPPNRPVPECQVKEPSH